MKCFGRTDMEKLNELLRDYAQSIRRDDGTAFIHADAIREYFRARPSANETGAEGAVNTGDRLTDEKANHIIQRDGYKLTGAVLCASDGRRCIIDLGAVRWLTKAEAWKLMHPDESRSPAMAAEAVAWRSWKDGDGYGFWDTRDEAELASAHDFEPEPLYTAPPAAGEAAQPSLTNPLTPYGMLVRALRIVTGTVLGDMAQHLGYSPAALSAVEFGRKPLTAVMVADTAAYFASVGIPDTLHALSAAWRAHALVDGADHAA